VRAAERWCRFVGQRVALERQRACRWLDCAVAGRVWCNTPLIMECRALNYTFKSCANKSGATNSNLRELISMDLANRNVHDKSST